MQPGCEVVGCAAAGHVAFNGLLCRRTRVPGLAVDTCYCTLGRCALWHDTCMELTLLSEYITWRLQSRLLSAPLSNMSRSLRSSLNAGDHYHPTSCQTTTGLSLGDEALIDHTSRSITPICIHTYVFICACIYVYVKFSLLVKIYATTLAQGPTCHQSPRAWRQDSLYSTVSCQRRGTFLALGQVP